MPPTPVPIPLSPALIETTGAGFAGICTWPFADAYITRLLRDDIPQRAAFGNCRAWTYRDPQDRLVGFGTLDICDDYRDLTGGQPHTYIPLLAVNPTIKSLGYGRSIVEHLVSEAGITARAAGCHHALLLDVYTSNHRAISLYHNCGFVQVSPRPIPDPLQGDATYIVMARRVA
jgi:ribosomal protein S18 acetylase RimI-like enzyme